MIAETAIIHPTAQIDPSATIWHYAVILAKVVIGPNVSIGAHCEIGRGSTIGAGARIGSGTFLPSHSTVGRNVFIGPRCAFADDRHPKVNPPGTPYDAEPPVIEPYASVGIGCVVLPGVRIGRGAMIGAGSVVTRDVPPNTLWRGEPARMREPSPETAACLG